MRALMIGLGLGGQMITNSTMEELERVILDVLIYELSALPLAVEGRLDTRFTGVPHVKRVLAEGIAFDVFFDPKSDPDLVANGIDDFTRYQELKKKIDELVKAGELPREDANDLKDFADFVLWGKQQGLFTKLANELIDRNVYIIPLVINSSTMDFHTLDEKMKRPVTLGATFDGHLATFPRHPATMIGKKNRLLIGRHLTHGGGAGWDNTMGMRMAADSEVEIKSAISRIMQDAAAKGQYFNMYIVTYGSGGGTGSGAGPVVAKVLKEIDPDGKVLSFPILPAPEECRMRTYNSVTSLAYLAEYADGVGLVSLEDFRGMGESIDDAYDKIDAFLGKFFVTMIGSEELPRIKNEVKAGLLRIVSIAKAKWSKWRWWR